MKSPLVSVQASSSYAARLTFVRLAVVSAVCFLVGGVSVARAAITVTGSVSPSDPATWTSSTISYIGSAADGSVTVDGGSVLLSDKAYLGCTSGVSGEVTVSGTGSQWTNSRYLFVGLRGTGTLNVTSGGYVENYNDACIGNNSGSIGMATVSGTGSKWTNSTYLYVGNFGTGTLNVTSGGSVGSLFGYIGFESGSVGTATVSGTGSKWTNSGDLYVGSSGTGTLNVTSGGSAGNTIGYIGCNSGSVGAVTVSGAGSRWTNSDWLYVGNFGTGTLNVTSGGSVENYYDGYIGFENGSVGTATVSGSGSKWTNNGSLYVGSSGTGTLTIADGGVVSVSGATIHGTAGKLTMSGGTLSTGSFVASANQLSGTGVVNTCGIVCDYNLTLDSTASLKQSFTFSGVTVNADLTSGFGNLGVNTGSLTVTNGLAVESSEGYVGYYSGSVGVATVSGTGSTWTNSGDLYVGSSGTGTLNIDDGGVVSVSGATILGTAGRLIMSGGTLLTGSFVASANRLSGTGVVNARGVVCDFNLTLDSTASLTQSFVFSGVTVNIEWASSRGYLGVNTGSLTVTNGLAVESSEGYVGYYSGSVGTATVSGTGSKWTSSSLYVGNSGTGTLDVTSGGYVSSRICYIGYGCGSVGTATVSGTGSKWTNNGSLFVGNFGTGMLNVTSGGSAGNTIGCIGCNSGSVGVATVSGSGSKWMNSSDLYVGRSGTGTLNVTSGGYVENTTGYIGYNSGSVGTATVSGSGSKWTSSYLYVGYSGTGMLNVTSGGSVVNYYDGYIGCKSGSVGTATVSGTGSQWTNSGWLHVGYFGAGTLNVTSGGSVGNGYAYIGYNSGSVGAVTVDGTGSKWTNSGALYVGNYGTGTLNVTSGGSVGNTSGYVGCYSGSVGAVTISGTGSTWTNIGDIDVGYYGTGALNVTSGGSVGNAIGCIGYYSGSVGVATVSGSGSKWTNRGPLYVGRYGVGTLNVTSGGSVGNAYNGYNGYIGCYGGSVGMATVCGTGSIWMNSGPLYVGNYGVGTLSVTSGGSVGNNYGYIGYNSGSYGLVTVSGSGSKWTNNGYLYIGNSGTGTLTIADGGTVSVAGTISVGTAGTLNLTGGSLVTQSVVGSSGAAFNFGGGTLQLTKATTVALGMTLTGTNGNGKVDTNGFAVTLSGSLSGVGGLTKTGSGVLTLAGTETFTGGVFVQKGKLVLAASESNVATLDVETAAGATLSITGGTHTLDSITGSGMTNVSGTATLTVACLVQDTLILGGSGAAEETATMSAASVSSSEVSTAAVPEPTTILLVIGACGFAFAARGRR